jgi:hypothetical protein
METWERPSTRGGFLRRAVKTLAVGLGVALVPAAPAFGRLGASCCPDSSCPPCGSSFVPYRCFDECVRQFCCICQVSNIGCFEKPCGVCQ